MIKIKAYTLFDEWNLYESNSWANWFLYNIGFNVTQSNIEEYLYNDTTGELYDTNNIKVGQYGQETLDPYIYMTDSSYIRVLSKYESIIKESEFAKKCEKNYLDNKLDDV
jgi:hypothetical protein